MEVQFGPNSIDEPNLLYKLQCKIKVFNTVETLPNRGYNLVASSSKYGLVFVAVPSGTLSVYHLSQLIDKECEPPHMTVGLPEKPTHISTSCDYELLAVTGGNILCIYKVTDFQNPNVTPALSIKCDVSPSNYVSAMQWNPCIPDSIALAYYDGTLLACTAGTGEVKKVPSKARCICWSPKGKQLVTGNSDGSLCQYKPDLTPAKAIPPPNLFEGAPVEACAVYWISTFQFSVVYKNATNESRPSLTIVNIPKGGQATCLNYDDICYSMGSARPWYYYLHGLAQWNIILSASSNSMELATIGSADGATWIQWCQPDEARPELPLTDKKQENYPVGVCIDTCAIHQLPWGENETLPHMPLLHVVSQTGLLTIFNLINLTQVAQICSPPQQLVLPANALSCDIPGEGPKVESQPTPAPPADVKPQLAIEPAIPTQSTSPFSAASATPAAAPIKIPSYQPSAISTPAPHTQVPDQKSANETSVLASQQNTAAQPKPQPTVQPEPPKQAPPQPPPENAALKAEQDKINKQKANQEMKNILVKEVNDFQNELYNFMLKTRETQARIQRDIESINSNFNFNSLDTEQLKKECSIDELRNAIVQLKLELVRACAVIAEARTHSNAREYHQWTQADPLTTKRVASVKKLAYYVQTQLDQAQKALDYKWSEMAARDLDHNKPGKRMIRPILDDVYQPLVKQQEILSRQQAVLHTLKKTLTECDVGPLFKSSSLLRSTPFKNKDPLSKLTKNILNMSIEPQTAKQKGLLSAQKLETLRDILSNHKTTKIKPINVELRQHFVTIKENYEKCVKAKIAQAFHAMQANNEIAQQLALVPQIKQEPEPKLELVPVNSNEYSLELVPAQRTDPSLEMVPVKTVSLPPLPPPSNAKPTSGLTIVPRTLFTDEPEPDQPKSIPQLTNKPFQFTPQAPASPATKSALKDLLQTKSQANLDIQAKNLLQTRSQPNIEAKNDTNNIFMGQKICSPTGIARSSAPTPAAPPFTMFTSKPISAMSNMYNKLPTSVEGWPKVPNFDSKPPALFEAKPPAVEAKPQAIEAKPQAFEAKSQAIEAKPPTIETKPSPKIQSSETGEPESTTEPPKPNLKPDKPMTNLFRMKPIAASTPVPDVLNTQQDKTDKAAKPTDIAEKSKENAPKTEKAKVQNAPDKNEVKPLGDITTNKTLVFGQPASNSSSSNEKPVVIKEPTEKTDEETATENKATDTAPKPSTFTPSATPPKSELVTTKSELVTPKSESEKTDAKSPSASSIFGAAVASQPKTDSIFSTQSSTSIFASTSASAFGAKPSVLSTPTSVFGKPGASTTTQSSAAESGTPTTPKSDAETPEAATSVFGSTSFGTTTTTTASSVFGQASGAFAPAATPLFATTTASSFSPSVFGTQTSTDSTSPSAVFGSAASQAFGTSSSSTIFGSASPGQSVFGGQTTQATVFGTPTQTTQASVFGTPTQSSQTSVFGTQTTQTSVFGTPTQASQASVFGTPTQTTQASVFGTPTQSTQPSVFGTPTQTTQASVFGTPPPASQASVFGAPAANSGSLFGGAESNLFASASISTTSAPTAGSGGNIFGGSTTGSVFGSGGTNVFGGKTAFGQSNNTAASIFGGAASFGQKPAANLWGSGNATSAGFGSTGFGQPTTQASSIFGGSGGSFSAPSAGAFGSPQTPAFGTGESQPSSVFGSPQQQSATGFGASSGFGSKPAFGQPAGFGSPTSGAATGFGSFGGGFNKSPSGFGAPAAFGGAATFGAGAFGNTSPGKVFGGAAPTGGFGSPTQQSNATFENLATQNTLTFGNLAQQSPQQSQQPSFNTSPQFTGWRG